MKILFLNWKDIKNPAVGGAEIIVYELAKRLVKNGHVVTWFCGNFSGAKKEEVIDGIKIVRKGLPMDKGWDILSKISMYISAPIYYWSLGSKPDLVIDMSNTIYWLTPLWALKSRKLAYLNQFAKEVFFYEYPPIISHFGYLLEKFQYLIYRHTPFICYSNSTKEDLIEAGIPSKNIRLFTLGIDHSRYFPGIKSKEPLFVCVNRLVKMKRTDLAIAAIDIVRKKYQNVKLVISGSGYERERLEKLRERLNLKKNVIFLDKNIWFFNKSSKDKKVTAIQLAWALIFPSVKEGWGMTVTEAAACGTPSIVSNVTGLRDSVIKDKTGLILSKNPSVQELSEAIIKIIENESLRTKLSQEAVLWAKNFNWDRSYREFKRVIMK